jgi:hypothetical protein
MVGQRDGRLHSCTRFQISSVSCLAACSCLSSSLAQLSGLLFPPIFKLRGGKCVFVYLAAGCEGDSKFLGLPLHNTLFGFLYTASTLDFYTCFLAISSILHLVEPC